jgi:hypothetical protein
MSRLSPIIWIFVDHLVNKAKSKNSQHGTKCTQGGNYSSGICNEAEIRNLLGIAVPLILTRSIDWDVVFELIIAVDVARNNSFNKTSFICNSNYDLNPVIRRNSKEQILMQLVRFLSQIKKITQDILVSVYSKNGSSFVPRRYRWFYMLTWKMS